LNAVFKCADENKKNKFTEPNFFGGFIMPMEGSLMGTNFEKTTDLFPTDKKLLNMRLTYSPSFEDPRRLNSASNFQQKDPIKCIFHPSFR
jgi:hypothetical protein